MTEQSSSEAMLTGGDGSSWFGSWIQSAKAKSAEAISFVKRDLAEFTSTMHDDGVKVAATVKEKLTHENASAATEKVKKGMTTLLGGLSKALVVEPSDDYRVGRVVGGEAVLFDRHKARLHTAQIDPATYTVEPEGGRYQEWCEGFNVDNMKGDISQLLVSNPEVRSLYTQLVPFSVSNVDFWRRYYYKILLLEEDEQRRRDLKKRAETVTQGDNDADTLDWDEDDETDDWTEVKLQGDTRDTCQTTPLTSTSSSPMTDVRSADSDSSDPITGQSGSPEQNTCHSDSSASHKVKDRPDSDVTQQKGEDTVQSGLKSDIAQDTRNKEMTSVERLHEDVKVNMRENITDRVEDQVLAAAQQDKLQENDQKHADAAEKNNPQTRAENPTSSALTATKPVETLLPTPANQSERSCSPAESRDSSEPSLTSWSALSDEMGSDKQCTSGDGKQVEETTMTSQRNTPSSTKESLDEDWEKDFDVEVTEEDMQAVRQAVSKRTDTNPDDKKSEDWEDW